MSMVETRRDVLRRTAGRTAKALGATIVLSTAMNLLLFGHDLSRMVSVQYALVAGLIVAVAACAVLAGALSYRTSLLLLQLNCARAELVRLSQTDQLTGLPNRRGFDSAAIAALETCGSAVALMCDIDRFKAINDRYGHEFGDAVLIQIARVFQNFSKDHDALVARHGGEEFAVLLTHATLQRASELAEELRERCASQLISSAGASTHVTISIGLAAARGRTTLPQIMSFADRALYAAKNGGRNRIATVSVAAEVAPLPDVAARA